DARATHSGVSTPPSPLSSFFLDTASPEIYTLSLHDALPISARAHLGQDVRRALGEEAGRSRARVCVRRAHPPRERVAAGLGHVRSEEHTSELQSLTNLVCRLLLEKKNKTPRTSSLRN